VAPLPTTAKQATGQSRALGRGAALRCAVQSPRGMAERLFAPLQPRLKFLVRGCARNSGRSSAVRRARSVTCAAFPAPSGLIGREACRETSTPCRPFGRHGFFDPVLWEIYLNLEREPGAGEANHDIAVRIRVVAKAVAPSAWRWGEAAG